MNNIIMIIVVLIGDRIKSLKSKGKQNPRSSTNQVIIASNKIVLKTFRIWQEKKSKRRTNKFHFVECFLIPIIMSRF